MSLSGKDTLENRLEHIVIKYDNRPDTNDVQFALTSPSHNWSWQWSSPTEPKQYFIASTTKLYVTALIMQLRAESKVDIDQPAVNYLPQGVMDGIHIYKGMDYGYKITVRGLLSHTSGIADYFEQKQFDGSTTFDKFMVEDFAWSFEDVISISKNNMAPRFAPSTPGKAFYSDTNYQLLGKVIEFVTGQAYEAALQQRILDPLQLRDTYPYTMATLEHHNNISAMLYGKEKMHIPKAMASVRADGGIVSTTEDGLVFLQAFMTGKLFPKNYLVEMQAQWNAIFSPMDYGMGLMRYDLPRYYTIFVKVPAMVGHSGASGAVLYYQPELDLYISGTVNQIKNRSLPYRVMTQLLMTIQNEWKN